MNNTSLASKRITYTSKPIISRIATNEERVAMITNALKQEYLKCRENPGYCFDLKDTLCYLLSTTLRKAFTQAALIRGVLIPKGSKVTYKVSQSDYVAEPNDMRTVDLLNEASYIIHDRVDMQVLARTEIKKILGEFNSRLS